MWAPVLMGVVLFAADRLHAVLGSTPNAAGRLIPSLTLLAGQTLLPTVMLGLGALAWRVGGFVSGPRQEAWIRSLAMPSLVLAAIGAWPALWVGAGLASGAWISEQSFAPAVQIFPLFALLVAVPVAVHVAFGRPTTSARLRWSMTGALGFATLVLILANQRIAVGLYPEFHLTVHVCAAVTGLLMFRRILAALRSRPPSDRWLRRGAPVASLLALVAPLMWFNMSGPTRGALVLRSPIAADWLRQTRGRGGAHLLHDTLADLDVEEGQYDPDSASAPRGLIDGREYNVLLVVVDVMRADALPPARPEEGNAFSHVGDTPNLDAWIEGTYRFRNTYTVATKTHLAMPAMFRSVEASDNNVTMGVPLGLRMEALGRTPVAVAIDYFFAPKSASVAALVEGFGEMVFYEKKHNEEAIPATIEMLRSVKDERFFLWLHMYNVHEPGFDGTLLGSGDCSRINCYRRSLRYLDQEFAKLLGAMDELGLRDNTIVVLVADHGEGLGDHGLTLHGPNVFEEDVRVPLMFAIPGHQGRLIEDPVGTIDVAPTLVDLLGGPKEPQDRGRSLVPMMAGSTDVPPRPYYFQNENGKVMGVVSGRDKVIYDSSLDVVHRFDLAADPDEFDDIFDATKELDRELLRVLIGFNPAMVSEELEDSATLELLSKRFDEIDPDHPGAALPLLVRLIDHKPDAGLVKQAVELFKASNNRAVRLLILRYLYDAAPKRFVGPISEWLLGVADTPQELEIVEDLAAQGQPGISGRPLVARLEHYASQGPPATWAPYLRLMRPWFRTAKTFKAALTTMLERSQNEAGVPHSIIELVLDFTATLESDALNAAALATVVRPLLAHSEPRVRAMAIRAMGGLSSRVDAPLIRKTLADFAEDPRVRRESASALAEIEGADAVEDLIAAANNASMEVIVVRQLTAIGSDKGLPFLRKIAASHYNAYLRREATRSIARIEMKTGNKGKGKPKAKGTPRPKPTTKPTPRAKPTPEPTKPRVPDDTGSEAEGP